MGSLDLHLEPICVGDCAVVRVSGELDAFSAPGLRDMLSRPGSDHVVVDLRSVTFLDSTGLGVLVGALKRLRRHDGSLKVVAGRGGRVRRLFELTNLASAFGMHASVLDAIAGDEHWQAATARDPMEWCHRHGLELRPGARLRLTGRRARHLPPAAASPWGWAASSHATAYLTPHDRSIARFVPLCGARRIKYGSWRNAVNKCRQHESATLQTHPSHL